MTFKYKLLAIVLSSLFLAACGDMTIGSSEPSNNQHPDPKPSEEGDGYIMKDTVENINDHLDYEERDLKKIYFGGGCFWGVEAYMQKIYGVAQVNSGYANGNGEDPSYEDVINGDQGFVEAVEVTYDPERISLDTLIDRLFKVIDPTSENKQGNDVGVQYRTGIYYTEDDEESVVKKTVEEEQQYYEDEIVTEAVPLKNFYKAEDFHQDYLEKNPNGYCHINLNAADSYPIDPIDMDKDIVKDLSE